MNTPVWPLVAPAILALRDCGKGRDHAERVLKKNFPRIEEAARGVDCLYRHGALPDDLFWSKQRIEDAL